VWTCYLVGCLLCSDFHLYNIFLTQTSCFLILTCTEQIGAVSMSFEKRIEPIDIDEVVIEDYFERFDAVAKYAKVFDKKTFLFATCGPRAYQLLKDLKRPEDITDGGVDFDALKVCLTAHLKPKKVVIAERYIFYRQQQEPGETVSEYLRKLRKKAESPASLETRWRRCCGTNSCAGYQRPMSRKNCCPSLR
jgi:hypothetical protein